MFGDQSPRLQASQVFKDSPEAGCHASTAQFGHREKHLSNRHSGVAPESLG